MKTIHATLWEAQIRHWPKSIRLSPEEVIEWAFNNPSRCNSVLMTIQYPTGVFYKIPYSYTSGDRGPDVHGEYRGFRFGILGSQYLSF